MTRTVSWAASTIRPEGPADTGMLVAPVEAGPLGGPIDHRHVRGAVVGDEDGIGLGVESDGHRIATDGDLLGREGVELARGVHDVEDVGDRVGDVHRRVDRIERDPAPEGGSAAAQDPPEGSIDAGLPRRVDPQPGVARSDAVEETGRWVESECLVGDIIDLAGHIRRGRIDLVGLGQVASVETQDPVGRAREVELVVDRIEEHLARAARRIVGEGGIRAEIREGKGAKVCARGGVQERGRVDGRPAVGDDQVVQHRVVGDRFRGIPCRESETVEADRGRRKDRSPGTVERRDGVGF